MKKSTCFAYTVENGIYINITNRCTNSCVFCIRNNGDGAYGSDSLWLEYEPSVSEMIEAVKRLYNEKTSELVFCGYGEPTQRLEALILCACRLKEEYPDTPLRINTNGHSDLINGCDTSEKFGVFDKVCVSLNASASARYDELCRSKFPGKAFDSLLNFADNVNKRFKNVQFSVVREMLTDSEIKDCISLSDLLGIPLRIRNYISE